MKSQEQQRVSASSCGPADAARVLADFFYDLDTGELGRVVERFSPRGTWVRAGEVLTGRDSIASMLRARSSTLRVQHVITNVRLNPTDDAHASLTAYMTVYRHAGQPLEGPAPLAGPWAVGICSAEISAEQGGWLIDRLSSQITFQLRSVMMRTQQQPRPMLTHLGIHVRDLERMVGFYQRVLGLIITDRGRGTNLKQDMVFMSSSPSIHHQLLLCTGRPADDAYNHINQISFNVRSIEEMQEIARRLQDESTPLRMQLDHGNAWSIYFHDPEGNTVEVYADSPWHVPQPCGRVFDITRPADEISAATYEYSKGRPGFMPRTQYEEQMKSRMGPAST